MAMRLRRRRQRNHLEGAGEAPRPFCVTQIADPFGDIDRTPYDAARNLTETGGLPDLFSEQPNAHTDEIADVDLSPRSSLPATEVTATATAIVAEPTS